MPKVSYSNAKGLHQESGNGFLPLGGALGETLGLGQIRTQAFTIDMTAYTGGDTTFGDGDVLQQLGSLDVSVPTGLTATKIVISDVIVNVTETAGTTLAAQLSLSATSGTAQNAAVSSGTEVVGAGATYRNGQEITVGTEADLNLNTAACTLYCPNVAAAIASKHLYLVTSTALAATPSQGAANIVVKYYVI